MSLTAEQLAALMPDATQVESDEPEMESSLHYFQLALLVSCLEWLWREQNDFFIGANLTIYFNRQQLKNKDFRGPDFFLVKQTEKRPRKSWVTWEEGGKYPDLIIELLSESTENVDKTIKKDLYQNRFRTPDYFWFSPDTLEFSGFRLVQGKYEEIDPNEFGWLWSESLGLYLGIYEQQLRYFTLEGQLVPTPEEDAQQQRKQVEQVQQQANQQQRRAEQLAAQLRALGIEPEA
ncbi:unknown [Crocosphaera subtropica ATCC 51142]|uniref:Putative restriction endonuclease domain-containing protein n=1 Tax=Crocosphaera subtropica (strain ATCC 51142 / BH68) TaxID=43989 RepID=B1WQ54_CROS5|nr:Uma2 family endonuclease [Crocosphaera subtropica]ACB49976.1 unknown [Crocosphaera subtropica ATCC 51142]